MGKRSITTTKEYLINAPLPQFEGDTYTVIPHQFVIDKAMAALAAKGFEVKTELYRCNHDAQIAQGVYHLSYGNDPDMGMMFAWSNSYDKSMRFKCAIGGYVFICMNGVVSGDMGAWGRKHTGSADQETENTIQLQMDTADIYYNQLVQDKENMKLITVDRKLCSELVGRLFLEHRLITVEQISIIGKEMDKPSFNYAANLDSLWVFYNHVTHALKTSHPRNWIDHQRMVHWFLTNEFGIQAPIAGMTTPNVELTENPIDVPQTDPRQTNLLDAIAEAENTTTQA